MHEHYYTHHLSPPPSAPHALETTYTPQCVPVCSYECALGSQCHCALGRVTTSAVPMTPPSALGGGVTGAVPTMTCSTVPCHPTGAPVG